MTSKLFGDYEYDYMASNTDSSHGFINSLYHFQLGLILVFVPYLSMGKERAYCGILGA
jgi:hypothetical protein